MKKSKTLRVVVLADPGAQIGLRESDTPTGPWTSVPSPPTDKGEAQQRWAQARTELERGELSPNMHAWLMDVAAAFARGDPPERAQGIAKRRGRKTERDALEDVRIALAVVQKIESEKLSVEEAVAAVTEKIGLPPEDEGYVDYAYQAMKQGSLRVLDLREGRGK